MSGPPGFLLRHRFGSSNEDAPRAPPRPACGESTRRPMAAVFKNADAKHRLRRVARRVRGRRRITRASSLPRAAPHPDLLPAKSGEKEQKAERAGRPTSTTTGKKLPRLSD